MSNQQRMAQVGPVIAGKKKKKRGAKSPKAATTKESLPSRQRVLASVRKTMGY